MIEYVVAAVVIFAFMLGFVLGGSKNGGFSRPRSRAEYIGVGLWLLAFILGVILGSLLP
jgi:VIT1/CCC1 family predicted Fe2+/Mn2+ transporter